MEKSDHIENLYQKYLEGNCNPQELDELLDAFGLEANKPALRKMIAGHFEAEWDGLDEHALTISDKVEAKLFPLIRGSAQTEPKIRKFNFWPKMAAAAILIVIGAGLFFYNSKNEMLNQVQVELAYKNDIAPGKVGATLTLANGKKIRLADVANGEIAKEAGISVSKTADGQIVYQIENASSTVKTNTLTTAKGETYVLTLPDRSKVWLNAASSLTYTVKLNDGGLRKVKLTGEGYFEIAKDKAHPFVVESRGQLVEVLGTHFNVRNYADEDNIKTTLLEGRVKVVNIKNKKSEFLAPGQQSSLKADLLSIENVNPSHAIAWMDGYFRFSDATIQEVMQNLSRWYNIEVLYKGTPSTELFNGTISMKNNISTVLKALSSTNTVKFKVEGRRVTVE